MSGDNEQEGAAAAPSRFGRRTAAPAVAARYRLYTGPVNDHSALSELGEFTLIDRIVERLGDAAAGEIAVPPGDDAAVWHTGTPYVVATIDALAEGSHWRSDTMTLADVGWRAVAANVSDLAAMGAVPRYLLVTAQLAPSISVEEIDAFTDGLAGACRAHDVRVAGGDIIRARETSFSIAAYGSAEAGDRGDPRVLRRDAARPGDRVAVSGTPGASAAGLALINAGRLEEPGAADLYRAHRRPLARPALGLAAVRGGVRCGMDVSDGLLQDLGHIARRSNVGIEVACASVPLHPAAVELLGAPAALDLALGGGEDFELALTGDREALVALDTAKLPVTVIGRVVAEHPGEVIAWTEDGGAYEPPRRGWDQARASGERATTGGATPGAAKA